MDIHKVMEAIPTVVFGLAAIWYGSVVVGQWLHHRKYGWYVATSGDGEVMSADYFEGANCACFYGERRGKTVQVPSEDDWDTKVPEFVRGRRPEVLGRLKQELGYLEFAVAPDALVGRGGPANTLVRRESERRRMVR